LLQVLTFRGATGGKGKKLRDFLTDMVNMCLDKEAGSTRLDILNYGNNNSANLSKALTDLLKVMSLAIRHHFSRQLERARC